MRIALQFVKTPAKEKTCLNCGVLYVEECCLDEAGRLGITSHPAAPLVSTGHVLKWDVARFACLPLWAGQHC